MCSMARIYRNYISIGFPTTSVFTADEYRAWLTRTPSTSAIYDRLKSNRDSSLLRQKGRFTFSAENLPERTRQVGAARCFVGPFFFVALFHSYRFYSPN